MALVVLHSLHQKLHHTFICALLCGLKQVKHFYFIYSSQGCSCYHWQRRAVNLFKQVDRVFVVRQSGIHNVVLVLILYSLYCDVHDVWVAQCVFSEVFVFESIDNHENRPIIPSCSFKHLHEFVLREPHVLFPVFLLVRRSELLSWQVPSQPDWN